MLSYAITGCGRLVYSPMQNTSITHLFIHSLWANVCVKHRFRGFSDYFTHAARRLYTAIGASFSSVTVIVSPVSPVPITKTIYK